MILVPYCGGPAQTQDGIYAIQFDPNPALLSGSACSSEARITGDPDWNVTLVTSYVTITETADPSHTASYVDSDVSAVFGSPVLPRAGYLSGTFSVDASAHGILGEYDVAYILFGSASNGFPRNFMGVLQCRN